MSESRTTQRLNIAFDRAMRTVERVAKRVHRPLTTPVRHAWAMRRPLTDLGIELTRYCNLTCEMCSVWEERKHGVSLEHAKRLLDEGRALGAQVFHPFGAEQFMRKDFLDILQHAHDLGYRGTVVSNGAMITPAHMDRLEGMPNFTINISIDGPRAVHDLLRGRGVYDKAVAAVHALTARRIRVGLAGVIMRETLDTLPHLIDIAKAHGIPAVSYQPFQTEISGPSKVTRFVIGEDQREELGLRLDELIAYARHREVHLNTRSLFPLIPEYLLDGMRPIPTGGCEIPSRELLVKRDGEVYPCFFMLDRSIGSVHKSGLSDLWHNEMQRELNREALDERCPGCLASCSDVTSYRRAG